VVPKRSSTPSLPLRTHPDELRLSQEQRDLIYDQLLSSMSGVGDIWIAICNEDFELADRLGRRFSDELQLINNDLGWGEGDGSQLSSRHRQKSYAACSNGFELRLSGAAIPRPARLPKQKQDKSATEPLSRRAPGCSTPSGALSGSPPDWQPSCAAERARETSARTCVGLADRHTARNRGLDPQEARRKLRQPPVPATH
jgi:hypothetical protein